MRARSYVWLANATAIRESVQAPLHRGLGEPAGLNAVGLRLPGGLAYERWRGAGVIRSARLSG